MLAGIALVVEDAHKGQKLAFRYPGPPFTSHNEHIIESNTASLNANEIHKYPPSRTESTSDTPYTSGESVTRPDPSDNSSHTSKDNRSWSNFAKNISSDGSVVKLRSLLDDWNRRIHTNSHGREYSEEFWNLNPEMFVKLFRPKPFQYGKPLQLTVDKLLFLAFPMQINRNENRGDGSRDDIYTSRIDISSTSAKSIMSATPAPLSSPLSTEAPVGISFSAHAEQDPTVSSGVLHQELTMFCVIFVLDIECERYMMASRVKLRNKCGPSSYGLPYPGSEEVISMFRKVGMQLTAGMLSEEHRCGYVSEQVHLMLLSKAKEILELQEKQDFSALSDRKSVV